MDFLSVCIEPTTQFFSSADLVDIATNLVKNLAGEAQPRLVRGLSALAGRHAEQVRDIAPDGADVVGMARDLAEERDGCLPDLARLHILVIDGAPGTSEPREKSALLNLAFDEGQKLLVKLRFEARHVVP